MIERSERILDGGKERVLGNFVEDVAAQEVVPDFN